ncbi:hypothetical protein EVAR_9458_1 [Eumeta japonica]|uniref:Uncharacterized protein n=1 Tax=Eumeta variegata TaxID=151549 RepID=A0A4C1UE03_EUMVA|nr:hypothetical protein EVAR_9458_1 [Eumeta japonica]
MPVCTSYIARVIHTVPLLRARAPAGRPPRPPRRASSRRRSRFIMKTLRISILSVSEPFDSGCRISSEHAASTHGQVFAQCVRIVLRRVKLVKSVGVLAPAPRVRWRRLVAATGGRYRTLSLNGCPFLQNK